MNHHAARTALRDATAWRKSIRSQGDNNCVEVTDEVPGWIGVRDSKLAGVSPILAFPADRFAGLIAAVRTNT